MAWHHHLNVGGVLVFDDYTGTPESFGRKSMMAVDHAVDGLIREPMYEFVGQEGYLRAYRKCTDDILYPMHMIKKVPSEVSPAWERLGNMASLPEKVVIFGAGETSLQTLGAVRGLYGQEVEVVFTDSFATEPGQAWNLPLVPFSPQLLEGAMVILGTIFEAEVGAFLESAGISFEDYYGFFEFVGWFHIGRFGYL